MSHRPPRPLIVARPINEWINRVNKKHEAFTKLDLSGTKREEIRVWASEEFINSSRRLVGAESSESKAAHTGTDGLAISIAEESAALDLVWEAAGAGRSARLTSELLRRLHSPASASPGGFRKAAAIRRSPKPPPPESVPAIVEVMCRWTDADSFMELHPVEQCAIAHLRLVEIQPFDDLNEITATIAASFFLLRADLPPLIIQPDLENAYLTALDEASRLNTRPMVELVAEATERALDHWISRTAKG